ncbi:MAG: NDP-sugar synthase, partial [Candidatus Binataceae bacterium]
MKTVLFATRTVPELVPLSGSPCLALLSVACKPLIVHTIEALARAALTDIMVVVSPGADAIEEALSDGARWGMRFEYVLATATESDGRVIERIRHQLRDEYLAVRGEILRTPIIAEFIQQARSTEARSIAAAIRGVDAGVRLIRDGTKRPEVGSRGSASRRNRAKGEIKIEFPKARLSMLDSLQAFHRANLDILAGHFAGLVIPGREVAPKVRVGRHTNLPGHAIKAAPLLIGERCSIAESAELGGEVVISNNVVIDRRAMIRSSVIMPNTYIGELVEVTNAIVAGNRLIHIDTGTNTIVTDDFLLASIHGVEIGGQVRDAIDRVIGAALLGASLCLWPIALIAAMAANPRKPLRMRRLVGNRKLGSANSEFRAFEFATPAPLLRYLPYL